MHVKLIGCLHLGHEWMAKWRGFESSEQHDEHLIKCWNSVVGKKDLVYILGDVTMESNKHYYLLDKLKGRKTIVLGNHDLPKHVSYLLNHVENVAGMVDYKGNVLTHAPIHPNEVHFCRYNIHAHIHHQSKLEECIVNDRYLDKGSKPVATLNKYICVDAHLLDYKPKTLEQLGIKNEKV
jgi:calcineurin-like phosphoesterase family protein